jgi:hypothetical protein
MIKNARAAENRRMRRKRDYRNKMPVKPPRTN